jgi:dihydroneopterin aldolase
MVTGKIFVNDILAEAFIGIYPGELLCSQKIEFGFEFEYAWDNAVGSDSIEDAVDYAILTEELKAFISKSKFNLLESLVFELAKRVLEFSPEIISARVYCRKINAIPGTSGPRAEICLP